MKNVSEREAEELHELSKRGLYEWLDWIYRVKQAEIREIVTYCQSPIERRFATAFAVSQASPYEDGLPIWILPKEADFSAKDLTSLATAALGSGKAGCIVAPQVKVGEVRVDFFMIYQSEAGEIRTIIVECDGHDFHERTKDQAIRDRSRDRAFQAQGHLVYRFTGAEIHRNAYKCASEVCMAMLNFEYARGGASSVRSER